MLLTIIIIAPCFSVNEFSKKTGDGYSLSLTDVKVLALTYELEVDAKGASHLRSEPIRRAVNTQQSVPVAQQQQQHTASPLSSLPELVEENGDGNYDTPMIQETSDNTEGNEDDNDDWSVVKRRKVRKTPVNISEQMDDTASVTTSVARRRRDCNAMHMQPGFYLAPEPENDEVIITIQEHFISCT